MLPVHPTLHQTPVLISGPEIARIEELMGRLDMRLETISDNVGDASTIKMVRSVMVKGIKSLVSESIIAAVSEGIDERVFSEALWTAGLPDPDLLIRTAGEYRVSNYLLWQISYAEIHVTNTFWPDFDEQALEAAIRDFASRNRRFGGLEN